MATAQLEVTIMSLQNHGIKAEIQSEPTSHERAMNFRKMYCSSAFFCIAGLGTQYIPSQTLSAKAFMATGVEPTFEGLSLWCCHPQPV
jgi:hypothetical protein